MALTTTNANMVFADRNNARRQSLGIPAGPDGDDPGLLVLESSSSAKVYSQVFVWADSTGALRYSGTLPTNEDSDGSVISTTSVSNANLYLSNLATTTAIPSSLVSDTTLTDDLGSSAIYWHNLYAQHIYLNSTAYLNGTTAGKVIMTGNMEFGATGGSAGTDVSFFGVTNTYDAMWDTSQDAFYILDSAGILFGTGASGNGDLKIAYTGASTNTLNFTQVATGVGSMVYGVDGKGIPQTWYVETASSYIKLDQDNDRMYFYIAKLDIANATVTYDFALSTNSLVLSCTDNSGAKLILGTTGTNGLDVTFQAATSGDYIVWDAGAGSLTFTDCYGVFLKKGSDYNGLAIPVGTAAAPSGSATAGSVYFKTDGGTYGTLYVLASGTTWRSIAFTG